MTRTIFKKSVEALAIRSGLPRIARALTGGGDLVLAYHNVYPDGETPAGDPSLHLKLSDFRRQLHLLPQSHDIVPLHRMLESPGDGRPRAAITFDDAYRGAVTHGVAELRSRGLTATIFVAPGRLGGQEFWWDRYEIGTRMGGGDFRSFALGELCGSEERVQAWAGGSGVSAVGVPQHARSASIDDLAEAISSGSITLGSHSWSHANLAALRDQDLEEELITPLAWLRKEFGAVTQPLLSYPYGLYSERVENAAASAGYLAAFAIEGGRIPRPVTKPYAIPRLNVPAGVSDNGFILRTSGMVRE
jgi:peptidoglycan/xylan/chitin deacetylase (PgdA/CDA1 family)